MKTPFKTAFVDGDECVMNLDDITVSEIRFNMKTKEIFIVKSKPGKTKLFKKGTVKNATKRKAD